MHNSRKVFLLDNEPRCIVCSYYPQNQAQRSSTNSYAVEDGFVAGLKEFKTYDENIKVGDYLVVPTKSRHLMTTVKVEEVDIDVDIESDKQMDWVIGVIDTTGFEQTLKQEQVFLKAANGAEKRKKKIQLRESVMEALEDKDYMALADHSGSAETSKEATK